MTIFEILYFGFIGWVLLMAGFGFIVAISTPRREPESFHNVIRTCREQALHRERIRHEAYRRNNPIAAPGDAEAVAQNLLRRLLTPEQLNEYERDGHFHVTLRNGTKVVLGGPSGRIGWYDLSQCVHPKGSMYVGGNLPPTDSIITQLLYLKNDPDAVMRMRSLLPITIGQRLTAP